jgi:hypothetical protein
MQSIEALKRRRLEQRFQPFAEGPVSADRDKAMWDWNESTWSGYDIIDQSAPEDASTVRLTPAGDKPVVVKPRLHGGPQRSLLHRFTFTLVNNPRMQLSARDLGARSGT